MQTTTITQTVRLHQKSTSAHGNQFSSSKAIERASNDNEESNDVEYQDYLKQQNKQTELGFQPVLVWPNIIGFTLLHMLGVKALYVCFTEFPVKTLIWTWITAIMSLLGATASMHRYWSHKTYKAKAPLRFLLAILATMAGQNSIFTWARDHRVHHKYAETNADPHNIKRGFFFAHIGWMLQTKHPDIKKKGAGIDISDLLADKLVMNQYHYFYYWFMVFGLFFPIIVPIVFWNESIYNSILLSFVLRYLTTLHLSWCINSAAHSFGKRPYDGNIEAREQPVALMALLGEAYHNYHHTFPQDYRASEFGQYLNFTTTFIDFFAKIGQVWDLRTVSQQMIDARKLRTGEAI